MRHARIPAERASEFIARVDALALEFTALPREGDREFAFVAGVFPTRRQVAHGAGAVAMSDDVQRGSQRHRGVERLPHDRRDSGAATTSSSRRA